MLLSEGVNGRKDTGSREEVGAIIIPWYVKEPLEFLSSVKIVIISGSKVGVLDFFAIWQEIILLFDDSGMRDDHPRVPNLVFDGEDLLGRKGYPPKKPTRWSRLFLGVSLSYIIRADITAPTRPRMA